MRSLFAGVALLLLFAGCGNDAESEPEATVTQTVTVTANPDDDPTGEATESETSTEEVDPFAPNIGERALDIGETREGEGIRSTIHEFKDSMVHPSNPYITPAKGNRWVGVDAEQCLRKTAERPTTVSAFNFAVTDNAGGFYDAEGSSWDDWPPLPQYPFDRKLQPGQCARGWMLMQVPARAKVTFVQGGDLLSSGDVFAEWRVR